MKFLVKWLFALAVAIAPAVSHAQTTYTLLPQTCPSEPLFSCVVLMSPTNPLGIYPNMHLYDINLAADAQNEGYIQFETVQGPTGGYLGSAQVTSSTVADNTVTFNWSGFYAPASGGEAVTGTVTFTFVTKLVRINRWTTRLMTSVLSGKLTINQ